MELQLEEEAFEFFDGEEFEKAKAQSSDSAAGQVQHRSKAWVKWLQGSLNQLTGAKGSTDGSWGGGTVGWLKTFQKKAGLPPDGFVTAATLKAMQTAGASAPPAWQAEEVGDAPAVELPKGTKANGKRCTVGGVKVPAIPGVISTNSVAGFHFEYVGSWNPVRDATGLLAFRPQDRTMLRTQSFVAGVKTRLEKLFAAFASQFQIEAILTAGGFNQRCISNTNKASDHSEAGAFDLVGVRWVGTSPSGSGLRETIVHNFADPRELKLLMRFNALARLHFPQVLDYNFNKGHQDHFHMDLGSGQLNRKSVRWMHHALEAIDSGVKARRTPQSSDAWESKALYELLARRLGEAKPAELVTKIPTLFDQVTLQIAEGRF